MNDLIFSPFHITEEIGEETELFLSTSASTIDFGGSWIFFLQSPLHGQY